MHFDDRLATVLRLAASSEALASTQFCQLVDLLGIMPSGHRSEQVDAAYLRLADLSRRLPAARRARMIAQPGVRLRNPRLVSELAQGEREIADAAVARADLGEEQWLDLLPALPPGARASLVARTARDERLAAVLRNLGVAGRALPASQAMAADPAPAHHPAPEATQAIAQARRGASITRIDERLRGGDRRTQRAVSPAVSSAVPADRADSATGEAIRAIVRRIEEFRKVRQPGAPVSPDDAPRLPLGDPASAVQPALAALDFETDGDGVITWADGDCAPMMVGLPLGNESRDAVTNALIRRRQPLIRRTIVLDGAAAVAGRWQLDATPRFDPPSGRFTGYAGRMRRYPVVAAAASGASPLPAPQPGLDRMRQILHELRNPVGGIQGCAEVMQQAIFGKIPHEYRALGASIAAEAARIMAALDEFERLVKMTGGSASLEQGEADLADVIRKLAVRLEPFSQPRGSGFALDIEPAPMLVPFDAAAMERLGWRILSVLASCAAPGEVLRLKLRERDGAAALSVRLPRLLAETEATGFPSADMPSPPAATLSSGAFGNVFALRLAAAEARSAGGWLARKGGKLRLVLPGLTADALGHSQKAG